MQFCQIPLNPLEPSKSTKYCFSPIYDSTAPFYQVNNSQRKENYLDRESLNRTLEVAKKERIVSWINSEDYSDSHVKNLNWSIISSLFIVFTFTFVGSIKLSDPTRKLETCSKTFKLYDTSLNKSAIVDLETPCVLQPHGSFVPLSIIIVSIFIVGVALLANFSRNFFKIQAYNDSLDRFNKNLEIAIDHLSSESDLKDEVTAKDVGITFPYLEIEQLPFLNFSQLKKARKYWNKLFQQRLNSSLFSIKQLRVWRLFQQIMNGKLKTQCKMLQNPLYQTIIGSEPLFFQTILQEIKLISLNDKKIPALCAILRDKILIAETANLFNQEDLIFTIMKVASGNKLKQTLQLHVETMEEEESELDEFFKPLVVVVTGLEEELEKRFAAFLSSGKLNINSPDEWYEFLKIAMKKERHDISIWLEANLIKYLSEFLKIKNLNELLCEIELLKMDSLKIKVDKSLNDRWKIEENMSIIFSDEYVNQYLFSKKHHLVLLNRNLKEHFIKYVENFEFDSPFNAKQSVAKLDKIVDKIETFFENEKSPLIQILKEKVIFHVREEPKFIEELANVAEENGNKWLISILTDVFYQNPEFFSNYWLSPFEKNHVLEEVISQSEEI